MSISTKAIMHPEDEAKKRGFIRMECLVADTNPRAVFLYERLGYELEGTKKMAFYLDGKYTDLKFLGKIFWDNLTEEGLHHR
ncbi:hypothetical protein [uncultured Methanocorpusculum sp.]|nr:hypothetical protein [uncultured Methanocorpusculum sp.]